MKNKIKIVWKNTKNESSEEINHRIDHAYDILFDAVQEKIKSENMPKCKDIGCQEPSISDNDGYCLGHICPPPIPLLIQHLNEIERKKKN